MNECCRCGVSGEVTRLFDAICDEGIVKVCQNCSFKDNFLMVKKPTTFQLKDAEKKESYLKPVSKPVPLRTGNKEDISLRDIVDRNLKINQEGDVKPRPDLIDNFNWTITRVRRARHISREQFARDLGESETLIKMVENGILPEDDNRLVNKLESFLGIRILKQDVSRVQMRQPARILSLDPDVTQSLTISDLQKMKREKEKALLGEKSDIEVEVEDIEEIKDKKKDDLSEDDINDLIFGK